MNMYFKFRLFKVIIIESFYYVINKYIETKLKSLLHFKYNTVLGT